MKLKILKLDQAAIVPKYAHPNDAGLDLYSLEEQEILPGESKLIHTGISIELSPGTEAQVRPRSGLALKHQITVLNTPGTIDADYRGEIGVILINHGKTTFNINQGMKIAQLVIAPVIHAEIEEVEQLSSTVRGEGGFGSSGV
ncbi:dUTP diphosphatase family protein [Lyngbya aestuarii BL J]|jgi:dUTP pyrophosphatase|uniref:Deoxyuridine 5'-triphosphate nucleotidohydrolase n=1 Tax=Lyngbya aestuarii BL J TaxID=1348334 RepID=U7QQA0_9CYAN|nr:dUTP diphosphatase [Lyngbya aestuarii]ERT09427.1 dUTP diphosphatase family protein [Lyngbya aestuarii BL J]